MFHDVRFPVDIALDSEGGPTRRTEIVALANGREHRNARQARSRRRYNAGTGVKSLDQLQEVIAFFEARMGALHSFRWRDPVDWSSGPASRSPEPFDQEIGLGDGEATTFQLTKRYESGGEHILRTITKPVSGTVRIAVANTELAVDGFTVDYATGEATLLEAPAAGAPVTAGFEFDTPVRFDTDELRISLAAFRAGEAPSVPFIEVLD